MKDVWESFCLKGASVLAVEVKNNKITLFTVTEDGEGMMKTDYDNFQKELSNCFEFIKEIGDKDKLKECQKFANIVSNLYNEQMISYEKKGRNKKEKEEPER